MDTIYRVRTPRSIEKIQLKAVIRGNSSKFVSFVPIFVSLYIFTIYSPMEEATCVNFLDG